MTLLPGQLETTRGDSRMQSLLALSLLMVAPAQTQDAEQLFRAMEKKITTAKSLKMVCKTFVEVGTNVYRVDVTLQTAPGNRLRLQAVPAPKKGDEELLVIADGKKLSVAKSTKGAGEVQDVPPNFTAKLVELLARSATGTMLDEVLRPGSQPAADDVVLSNFKLGGKEKVDGKREARLVEYELALKDKGASLKVKLWIDTQTLLPTNRVMTIVVGATESRFTEVFSEFTVDPTIDAKLFELPK